MSSAGAQFSPALAAYRGAMTALGPLAPLYFKDRARKGKEDAARLPERFGRAYAERPSGPLVWLHAASVGESGVAAQLIEALAARYPSLRFLVSTGTRTSADLMQRRALPNTQHVYAPLDREDVVRRFLAHWQPSLGVFIESELWPNLILAAEANETPLALVNARMSASTLNRWRRWKMAAQRLLRPFSVLLAADAGTATGLSELAGRPVANVGNLKLASAPPRLDANALQTLRAMIGARPVWLAASTHPGEDEILLDAHERVRAAAPDALLIIAPRHPERGEAVAALADGAPRRSFGQDIGDASVYVADTMGELALMYAAVPVAFVAGSLLTQYRGHNPVEAAHGDAAIVSGLHVDSFADLFEALGAANAYDVADDSGAIAEIVLQLMRDDDLRDARIGAAKQVIAHGADALAQTLAALEPLIATQLTEPRYATA